MKHSTYDLNEELDSDDVEKSIEYVAAVTGHKDLKTYKQIIERQRHISSLGAAKLLTNMLNELTHIVAYTPALSRPTVGGELLRTSLVDTCDHLHALREAMVESHTDDEGWSDVKVIEGIQEYGQSEEDDEEPEGD